MTIIIQTVIRNIVPFIMIFGAYVTFFGHLSPGGGFAGGSILAAGLILEHFAMNGENGAVKKQKISREICMKGVAVSLIGYGLIKGVAFLEGALHVHIIDWPLGTPGALLSAGVIPLLNIFIGIIVMFSFLLIYELFEEDETGRNSSAKYTE